MTVAGVARFAGVVGSVAIVAGSVLAALAYTGVDGEAYSPLTHWVSELGELGVSQQALVFNAGLVVGGIGFAVFMLGLAITGTGAPRYGYGPIGVVAGVSGALVGVFTMNDRAMHGIVASLFFNLGWIAVALASIPVATGRDPRFARWLALVGLATVAAFVAFLVAIRLDPLVTQAVPGTPVERPTFWLTALLEWLVIAGILLWTLLASLLWRPARRVTVPAWEVRP